MKLNKKKINLNKIRRVNAHDVMCTNSQNYSDIMTKNTVTKKHIETKNIFIVVTHGVMGIDPSYFIQINFFWFTFFKRSLIA